MSSTLLRLGMWTAILVLSLYIVHETFEESSLAEMIPMHLLTKIMIVAIVLCAAGVLVRVFEKTKQAVTKNKCRVCGAVVSQGAIYCRNHLRKVLELEDRKTHNTRIR
jgi:predicted nucleic acid-binding Zn ribbon protein